MECNKQNPCMGVYGNCLDVKITNDCNGHCAFCIERGGLAPPSTTVGELIFATNLLTQYRKVLILGGEPFLYPHLLEYLVGIRAKKDEIYITTNGSMFPTNPNQILAKMAKLVNGINISIHHYLPMENDRIVGTRVVFQDVADAIKVLKSASHVNIRINCNLVRNGLDSKEKIEPMVQLAKSLGADGIRFAELQNCADLYVSAAVCFDGVHTDPFVDGCEQDIGGFDLPVKVRLTCGLVNPLKPKPVVIGLEHLHGCHPHHRILYEVAQSEEVARSHGYTKVIYPNAQVADGWGRIDSGCHGHK